MRTRSIALAALVLIVGTLVMVGGPSARASCAGPDVSVAPARGMPGSTITVSGNNYWDRCNDVIICHIFTPTPSPEPSGSPTPTPSPTSSCETPDPMLPLQNISVEFAQGGRIWKLGVVDGDSGGAIRLVAKVPNDAAFGPAEIRACSDEPRCTYPKASFRVGGLADTGARGFWGPALAGMLATLVGVGALAISRRNSARA